ncbi:hypothetical protein [Rhizobium sp. AC27/96]|uniref:hypothetical protein n=1 Tax=Rhizobium sp. AC27/96 TaxID=1841653 RepID=UPI001146DA24|nr:hypothetical protein [Rhizobium sp. AC27/96]
MGKSAASQKAPGKVSHRLVAQSLVDISIDVSPEPEGDKIELRYNVAVDEPVQIEEHQYFFTCHLTVGKRAPDDEEDFVSVSATYACILRHSLSNSGDVISAAKRYAATSIWGAFSGLFAIISHQMRTSFPPLPPTPAAVDATGDPSLAPSEDDNIKHVESDI